MLGVLYTLNIMFLCYGTCLYYTEKTNLAMASTIALLGTPAFIVHGCARQYADIPLSFYVLACIVYTSLLFQITPIDRPKSKVKVRCLMPTASSWVICGVLGGLAVWTKHEGMGFALIYLVTILFILFHFMRSAVGDSIGRCLFILIGLFPFYLLKKYVSKSLDYQHFEQMEVRLEGLLTRSLLTLEFSWDQLLTFGDWGIFYLPIVLIFWVVLKKFSRNQREAIECPLPIQKYIICLGWVTVLGLLGSCLLIYTILDPGMDIREYIRNTWWRVLLQQFPIFVILILLMVDGSTSPNKHR